MNRSFRRLADLAPGDRFVAVRPGPAMMHVVLSVETSDATLVTARAADGTRHGYVATYMDPLPVDPEGPVVVWTDPVPPGTDVQIAGWVGAMRCPGAVALHVRTVRGDVLDAVFVARIVPYATGTTEGLRTAGEGGVAVSEATFAIRGVPDALPGDLVVASGCRCELEGDVAVFGLENPVVVGRFEETALEAFVPPPGVPRPGVLWSSSPTVPDFERFLDMEGDARLRAEPDGALVFNLPDDPDFGSMLVASSGWIFGSGQGMEHFEGDREPHGLLVVEGIAFRGGADWLDMTYTTRPALTSDLASFSISEETLPVLLAEGFGWKGDARTVFAQAGSPPGP